MSARAPKVGAGMAAGNRIRRSGTEEAGERPIEGTKSLDRALTVLLEVARTGARGLTLSECAGILGYSKATTHRVLQTLTRREFLRLDQERGTFTLGVTNLRLGIEFLESIDLRREALPTLRTLADSTGETAHLGRLSGTDVVYIEKVESRQAVRMYSRVGDTMPAYSTGVGKAILAFLDDAELDRHLPRALERRAANTITELPALRQELRRTRERGFSLDDVENEDGIRCAGAPVFDHTGRVQAGISVAGPASRMTRERLDELGPLVRAQADLISARVGYGAGNGATGVAP
jgi:DNA-binding IclR family transcriptional regulator